MTQKQLPEPGRMRSKRRLVLEAVRLGEALQELRKVHQSEYDGCKMAEKYWTTKKVQAFIRHLEIMHNVKVQLQTLEWVLGRRKLL